MGLFGRFIKERRADLRLTLSRFCNMIEYDFSNWSKIERGIYHPPVDETLLQKIAEALELSPDEAIALRDKAQFDRNSAGTDLSEDEEVLEMLPVLMRTIRETKPSREEMEELVRILREDFNHNRDRNAKGAVSGQ